MQLLRDNLFQEYPAQVDLDNKYAIVCYLRALLDLYDLLLNGYDVELQKFVQMLSGYGWGKIQIAEFIQQSSYCTRYESLIDSPMPEAGNQGEWNANCQRWRH